LYQKGGYVAETLTSVLAQTFGDWEILVIDNGSTDDGPAIVRGFGDKRIRQMSIEERGPGVARNRGIDVARGQWLHFLDADDLIEPTFFAEQMQAARENPDADIVVSSWQIFPDGSFSQRTLKRPTGFGQSNARKSLLDSAIAFTPWAPLAAIVRRQALPADLTWPEELDGLLAEDTTFWFRLVNHLRVAYSDSISALYRAQALGCRTRIDDPSKWFEGNHAAVSANLRFLSSIGRAVNAEQCESLMRLYSELYTNAKQKSNAAVAREALGHARYWLKERYSYEAPTTWPVRMRRLLGISRYSHLSRYANTLLRAGSQ
jgi:glycosyltransferase involved in cell wall biosynthesis